MSDISMSHASSSLYRKIPIKMRLSEHLGYGRSQLPVFFVRVRKMPVSKSTVLEQACPIMENRCVIAIGLHGTGRFFRVQTWLRYRGNEKAS